MEGEFPVQFGMMRAKGLSLGENRGRLKRVALTSCRTGLAFDICQRCNGDETGMRYLISPPTVRSKLTSLQHQRVEVRYIIRTGEIRHFILSSEIL
jgi:hypothetical protein